ncbi:hypothetical protein Rsub_08679 [Raphidocelis subcapitata]|uniref:F-box domain-containing protein n=1 Tax=Raphidocelis subcapitata TaxID=307507 RepID=A0A2V0PEU6_9CHLO|nr:hypothetical protein Rsub_08679 [Raphidocelis subcapitata]|eukprot:GBF95697.1 hypothetical protein Rsub_08679 [Raphidocelis subcapitata]
MHQPVYYVSPERAAAKREPPSPLAALPHCVLRALLAGLPCGDRCRLRLTCAAVAAAVAESFDALSIDAARFESGGDAAATSLARAAPLASRAVVRARAGAAPPAAGTLQRLFCILAASKPRLEAVLIEECWAQPPPFDPSLLDALAAARWRYGAALAAAAGAGLGARLRRLELPPAALAGGPWPERPPPAASPPASPGGDGDDDATAAAARRPPPPPALRGLAALREVVLREADPDAGPGLPPAALAELGAIPGLASLSVDLDTRGGGGEEAWEALMALAASPAAAALTQLRIGAAGPGEARLRASDWLPRLPRLRRLDLGRGIALDFSPPAQAGAGAGAASAPPPRLPPLEHVSLSQPRLDAPGWAALAALPSLASLELWRCGAPPPGALSRAAGAGSAGAAPFPALGRLHLGCREDPAAMLSAAAALPQLRALSLHHAGGGAGFGPDAPCRLRPLTGLTRLVLMPVAGRCHTRWSNVNGRVPVTPEEASLLAAMPALRFYDGPIPGCDAARWGGWAAAEQAV